jgi:hypothetical protein
MVRVAGLLSSALLSSSAFSFRARRRQFVLSNKSKVELPIVAGLLGQFGRGSWVGPFVGGQWAMRLLLRWPSVRVAKQASVRGTGIIDPEKAQLEMKGGRRPRNKAKAQRRDVTA